MKIVTVGATGTIGAAVVTALEDRHELVRVGNTRGDHQVDIKDSASIRALFEATGRFDALVSCTGRAYFGDFAQLTEAEVMTGVRDKLLGQVNLVLIGRHYANRGASFTLTSGVLSEDPIRFGACISMVNGALNSFVVAAAIELDSASTRSALDSSRCPRMYSPLTFVAPTRYPPRGWRTPTSIRSRAISPGKCWRSAEQPKPDMAEDLGLASEPRPAGLAGQVERRSAWLHLRLHSPGLAGGHWRGVERLAHGVAAVTDRRRSRT